MEIRRIAPDEGPTLMRVRLVSLLDAPYAFESTYTDSIQRPAQLWADRARSASTGDAQNIVFARDRDDVIGMAGAYTNAERPRNRTIWGLWVEQPFRNQGLGRSLVEALASWATDAGAAAVDLWVSDANEPARALYRRLGFEDTGDEQPFAPAPGTMERRLIRPAGPGPSV